MDSDSTLIMTKALLISLAIHLIFLFILGKFSFLVPPERDFSKISITIGNVQPIQASRSGNDGESNADLPETRDTEMAEPLPLETVKSEAMPKDEIMEPELPLPEALPVSEAADVPEKLIIPEQIGNAQKPEEILSDVPKEPDADAVSDVQAEASGDGAVESALTHASPLMPGDFSGSSDTGSSESAAQGSTDRPDLLWEGGGLSLRKIPEPGFTIPYNAVLPEFIRISFSVNFDGTVISVKILPPKSGHLDLDRQIRAYVAGFLFEEFDPSEEKRRGTLTLSLKAMGSNGI